MPKINSSKDDSSQQQMPEGEALLQRIRERFASLEDVDLPQPPREAMRELLAVPVFDNEVQEREFWKSHDSTEYLDWSKARKVRFPNLKFTDQT